MPLWKWSKTAATNASADSTINWAEGQAPSSVNDSARAMMARIAEYRDDIAGAIATSGTSTAFTVTSNQDFDSLSDMDGAMIAFVPHATSGSAPTLSVDGLTAKKVRFVPSVDIPDGSLVEGTPYTATYYNTAGEFILHNIGGNPYTIPLGSGLDHWGTTAPNSAFAFAYGQAISRTTYAPLFSLFGTTYGTGDGSTTFNIPDKRGRVSAGKDDMGGNAANRLTSAGAVTGTSLGYAGGEQLHAITLGEMAQHSHTATTTNSSSTFNLTINGSQATTDHTNNFTTNGGVGSFTTQGNQFFSQSPSVTIPSSGLTLSTTINNAGSGTAHNNVQPTIISNYIIRIL